MSKNLLIFTLATVAAVANAQHSSLKGVVVDGKTGTPLPGATLAESGGGQRFTTSDAFGRFYLQKLPSGEITIVVRFVGYNEKSVTVSLPAAEELRIALDESVLLTDEVIVYATRANEKTPTTFTTIGKQAIEQQNFGQDLPYLMNWSPSVVSTSDAGTGFGYTGVRIRGSDATSINVTINGIPYNDSESLGTFWVNIPDIASSTQSIQIQRGVGTSTQGAGAFGATINLQTNLRNDEPYVEVTNSAGFLGAFDPEYNSRRHTLSFGTGLINNHWIFDGRVSRIFSDGFIDRATADLQSYYFSAGYYKGNSMLKAIVFGGKERTYQAWYGVPESRLRNNVEAMYTTAMNEGWNEQQTGNLLNSGSRTFNPYTYPDQVDDYQQDHFQLHFSQRIGQHWSTSLALHLTPGRGYFEEFRYRDDFVNYGLNPVLIGDSLVSSTDLARRRWLDNRFYGVVGSASYEQSNFEFTVGGGLNRYDGDHFGEIVWAAVTPVPAEFRYYFNHSKKTDANVYAKANYQFTEKLSAFADLQFRRLNYTANGVENTQAEVNIREDFSFFNPKAGAVYTINARQNIYASASVANREPVRSDFINAPEGEQPESERLFNVESGYRYTAERVALNANYYYMRYDDQLIHTGRLNDVGAPVRTNVEDSYRSGIELDGMIRISERLALNANMTASRNRIKNFTEVLYDYGAAFDEYNVVRRDYRNTTIAFSPSVIAGAGLTFRPFTGFEAAWLFKHVGRQYLDNTSNKTRSLNPYSTNDLRFSYTFRPQFFREVSLSLLVNNLLDTEFESNGYTWGYLAGPDEYRENYYFPQAGVNFLAMISMKL